MLPVAHSTTSWQREQISSLIATHGAFFIDTLFTWEYVFYYMKKLTVRHDTFSIASAQCLSSPSRVLSEWRRTAIMAQRRCMKWFRMVCSTWNRYFMKQKLKHKQTYRLETMAYISYVRLFDASLILLLSSIKVKIFKEDKRCSQPWKGSVGADGEE